MTARAQRYGPGYSHMLSSLQGRVETSEMSAPRTTRHDSDMKCLGSPATTSKKEDYHATPVKLAPIIRPHHEAKLSQ